MIPKCGRWESLLVRHKNGTHLPGLDRSKKEFPGSIVFSQRQSGLVHLEAWYFIGSIRVFLSRQSYSVPPYNKSYEQRADRINFNLSLLVSLSKNEKYQCSPLINSKPYNILYITWLRRKGCYYLLIYYILAMQEVLIYIISIN